jgi:hypothetical protein
MLESFRKWLGAATSARDTWGGITAWAAQQGHTFRGVRRSDGFVVEGRLAGTPWRLEWGPSQRAYVTGFELRLRAELGQLPELQALILNRVLQESMEKDVFEQYVEGVQTRVDTRTPPEMRWLVMYPQLTEQELGELANRWAAVSNLKPWLERWLAGPLPTELEQVPGGPAEPMVLMMSRGRLMLRTGLVDPDVASIERWLRLFECALREAQRVSSDFSDANTPSTQPSLWAPSVLQAEPEAENAPH